MAIGRREIFSDLGRLRTKEPPFLLIKHRPLEGAKSKSPLLARLNFAKQNFGGLGNFLFWEIMV